MHGERMMQKKLTVALILLLGIAVGGCQSQRKIDDIAEVEEWNPMGGIGGNGNSSTLDVSGLVDDETSGGETLAGVGCVKIRAQATRSRSRW